MASISESNDPKLKSWVNVPAGSDFPIQNLPFGVFQRGQTNPGACVAIGDDIIALDYLHQQGYFDGLGLPPGIFSRPVLNDFFALGRGKIRLVRDHLSRLLRHDNAMLKNSRDREKFLMRQSDLVMRMPVAVGNYTDFYSSAFLGSRNIDPTLNACSSLL